MIFNTDTMFSLIARASGGSHSFAEAFFVSRRSDGSIEYLGSGVTWLLLAMSVGTTCMMIYMFLANRKPNVVPSDLIDKIEKRIAKKDFRSIIDLTRDDQTYLGKILHAAFREARFGFPAMMRALEQTADELATARLRRIEILNVVGQVSPMIGLFGTVWGIMNSFQSIAISRNTSLAIVAPGIAEALFATALGLLAAVPAVIAYNKFTSDSRKYSSRIENFSKRFISII